MSRTAASSLASQPKCQAASLLIWRWHVAISIAQSRCATLADQRHACSNRAQQISLTHAIDADAHIQCALPRRQRHCGEEHVLGAGAKQVGCNVARSRSCISALEVAHEMILLSGAVISMRIQARAVLRIAMCAVFGRVHGAMLLSCMCDSYDTRDVGAPPAQVTK